MATENIPYHHFVFSPFNIHEKYIKRGQIEELIEIVMISLAATLETSVWIHASSINEISGNMLQCRKTNSQSTEVMIGDPEGAIK